MASFIVCFMAKAKTPMDPSATSDALIESTGTDQAARYKELREKLAKLTAEALCLPLEDFQDRYSIIMKSVCRWDLEE